MMSSDDSYVESIIQPCRLHLDEFFGNYGLTYIDQQSERFFEAVKYGRIGLILVILRDARKNLEVKFIRVPADRELTDKIKLRELDSGFSLKTIRRVRGQPFSNILVGDVAMDQCMLNIKGLIQESAADILSGDFTIWPKLQEERHGRMG